LKCIAGGREITVRRRSWKADARKGAGLALCLRRGETYLPIGKVGLGRGRLWSVSISRLRRLPDVIRFRSSSRRQYLVEVEGTTFHRGIRDAFSRDWSWKVRMIRAGRLAGHAVPGHRSVPYGELRSLLDRYGLPEPEELAELTPWWATGWPGEAAVRVGFSLRGGISLRSRAGLVVRNVVKDCQMRVFMSGTLHRRRSSPPDGADGRTLQLPILALRPRQAYGRVVPDVGTRFRDAAQTTWRWPGIGESERDHSGQRDGVPSLLHFMCAVLRTLRAVGPAQSSVVRTPLMSKGVREGLASAWRWGRGPDALQHRGSSRKGWTCRRDACRRSWSTGCVGPPSLERRERLMRGPQIGVRYDLDVYEAAQRVCCC
jgi:hypothetical protein